MKKILTILLLICSLTAGAATRYVSTTGNDAAAGTIGAPWLTWQKGFTSIVAGDTLYIRGGVYSPTGTYFSSGYRGVAVNNIDGTLADPIVVMNYANEVPILDGANITNVGSRTCVYLEGCVYWKIKGLTVRNLAQYQNVGAPYYGSGGIGLVLSDHITLENCTAHHMGGSGIYGLDAFTDITVINCDSYSNHDPYSSDAYGGADGFAFTSNATGTILFQGCRAWLNSDDGYDTYSSTCVVTENSCWSWANGYREDNTTTGGNGNGIKLGESPDLRTSLIRIVQNCLLFNNRRRGIDFSSLYAKASLYNNTIYGNLYKGIDLYGYDDTYDLATIIKNNVVFGNGYNYDYGTWDDNLVHSNNSYNAAYYPSGPVATADDFVSVDTTGVSGARQSDGSLPVLTFLHLTPGSDLIGAGTTVLTATDGDGETWNTTPSIGAFEYKGTPTPPDFPGKYVVKDGKYSMYNGKLVINR